MTPPPDPTAAARQKARRQRMTEAGFVLYRRWVHPEDKEQLDRLAERLEKKRKV